QSDAEAVTKTAEEEAAEQAAEHEAAQRAEEPAERTWSRRHRRGRHLARLSRARRGLRRRRPGRRRGRPRAAAATTRPATGPSPRGSSLHHHERCCNRKRHRYQRTSIHESLLRRSFLRIFPVGFLGNASMNSIVSGTL